ncbi:MAG: mechanosensitive ion channel family protein [Saprospiraceae bacterium]|nr:mechanosensitive ion channel family protein [Saprospiraceae bacterium]
MNTIWNSMQDLAHNFLLMLPKAIMAVVLFALLFLFANITKRFSQRKLHQRMDDPLLARFISQIIRFTILVIAVMLALNIMGWGGVALGLLSTAGVGALVIGLAFKDIGENFLSGIVMAFNRPFRIGDTVDLNGHLGNVITLNLRDTQIKTFDGRDIFIPNGLIVKNAVINYTIDGYLQNDFTLGLDYYTDRMRAMLIIQDTLNSYPHILHEEGKKPDLLISELTSRTINVRVRYWFNLDTGTLSPIEIKKQLVNLCLERLEAAGIYLPKEIIEVKAYKELELPVKSITANGSNLS